MSHVMTDPRELPWLVRQLRALAYTLNLVRFSVLILAAGAGLLASDQGHDMLLAAGEDGAYPSLLFGITLWATSIWLWARVLLNIRLPDPPVDPDTMAPYRRRAPRVLGFLGFLLVALDAWAAGGPALKLILPCIVLGLIFLAVVAWRRKLARRLARRRAGPLAQDHWLWVDDQGGHPTQANLWVALNCGVGRFGLVMLVLGVVLFVWGVWDPLSMGEAFNNAILMLFVWGATFLPIGSLITYLANLKGVPILTILLVAALGFSLINDNHAIPRLDGTSPAARPHIDQALADWREANCDADGCKRFVVVATAGGGIRAAYWTGTVLGTLHQDNPGFEQQLFAISGVSGGSVGAAFYRAAAIGGTGSCPAPFRDCLVEALGKDFLTPLSAALLYPDLTQRFLPRPWLPDRGAALEAAWIDGFHEVYGHDGLNTSFADLAQAQGRAWPALFLNATWANSGGRLVATSLRLGQDRDRPGSFSALPKDQLDVIGHDIRLASAAHNSARFPYVSPPGSWRDADGHVAGRLQDGGLFENYGAETAVEILRHAELKLGADFHPLVIMISSDPELPETLDDIEPGPVKNFAAEILTTLRTIFRTRVAHGDEAAVWLKRWTEERAATTQAQFAYFYMCARPREDGTTPPLGWALSASAQDSILGFLWDERTDVEDGRPIVRPLPPAACRDANQTAERAVATALAEAFPSGG